MITNLKSLIKHRGISNNFNRAKQVNRRCRSSAWYSAIILASALLLSACGGAKVAKNNPMLEPDYTTSPSSTVYFIRPRLLKPKGYADNAISISIDDKKLMDIDAGAYTLVHLKPGKYRISTHSMTAFTNRLEPIQVSRYRDYTFKANFTYFIHLKQINEEFRGVFYDPFPASWTEAHNLLDNVTAYGEAQAHPIEMVSRDVVDDVDEASKLPPAFPEDLYPKEKYLLHPSPFKR